MARRRRRCSPRAGGISVTDACVWPIRLRWPNGCFRIGRSGRLTGFWRRRWARRRFMSSCRTSIQVILFYTTAAVMPEDGTIRFADDIYRHDARLDRALAMRRVIQ